MKVQARQGFAVLDAFGVSGAQTSGLLLWHHLHASPASGWLEAIGWQGFHAEFNGNPEAGPSDRLSGAGEHLINQRWIELPLHGPFGDRDATFREPLLRFLGRLQPEGLALPGWWSNIQKPLGIGCAWLYVFHCV